MKFFLIMLIGISFNSLALKKQSMNRCLILPKRSQTTNCIPCPSCVDSPSGLIRAMYIKYDTEKLFRIYIHYYKTDQNLLLIYFPEKPKMYFVDEYHLNINGIYYKVPIERT